MKFTTFSSDFTSKFAKSPFGDKTFEFKSEEVSLEQALELLRNEFVLNRNYTINGVKRLRRTKKDLSKYLSKKLEFVILDFDRVNSLYSQNQILKFFKENDYYVGIIPSRSWNGVDSFNMKGVIKAKGNNNKASILAILEEINKELFEYCKIDFTSINEGAYQAPANSEGVLLLHKGEYIPTFKLKEVERKEFDIEINNLDTVVDVCLNEFSLRGFTPTMVNEERGLISFSHPSEKTPNGYYLFLNNPFFMHHFNKDKSFNIFDSVKGNASVKEYLEEKNSILREKEFSSVGVYDYCVNINSRFIKVQQKETDLINKWFETDGLLKVKSAMGTGKSNVIDSVIKMAGERRLKVLLVTNRISVAEDFSKKYGIKMYSKGNYEIGDDLIVQFDSLWRYSLKHFDVVILDEFVSVMLHSRNTMGEYGNLNKVKLMYAMRTKLCMIADAFLFGLEDSLISTKPKYSIINSYKEDINTYEYPNIDSIVSKIKEISLEQKGKKKVSISCTTKTTAKALQTFCEDLGLKVLLLSADTQDEEKEDIYKVFELETHDFWDVLIYTPTLTVGVSILNETDHHFHIDESVSVDVVSSLQMIRRSRKAKNIHFYIRERKRYLETNIEALNKEVRDNLEKYYKKGNSLLVDIDEFGDFRISETGLFINEVEVIYNKLESNHKHSFEILIGHQISNAPKIVDELPKVVDLNLIKKRNKEEELKEMKLTLNNLKESEYDQAIMEDFKSKKFLKDEKEKLQKLMSEISKSLKPTVKPSELKEITLVEISKGFKFISKLKKLKFFLSKTQSDIEDLLSFIVSENIVNKEQIQYFKYVIQLKKSHIKLKDKITINEIKEVDDKIGWGDFKSFLTKIGYSKRGGVYILHPEVIKYLKFIK